MEGVDVGRHARLRRTIVDKGVRIPSGMTIGFDPEADAAMGLTISAGGVTVVPKGHLFPTTAPLHGSRIGGFAPAPASASANEGCPAPSPP